MAVVCLWRPQSSIRGNLYQFMVEFDHIPDSEIRRLLNAITSAINYIHTRNFCHRCHPGLASQPVS